MDSLQQKTGVRIRTFRLAKDYSLEELAHLANLNPAHLAKIERGELNFTIGSLEKILNALAVSPALLFNLEEPTPSLENPLIEKVIAYMRTMTIEEQRHLYKTATLFYHKRDQNE